MSYEARVMMVTGGAGFIGANFIRYVLAHEPTIKIINFDKLTYAGSLDHLENLPNEKAYHFIKGDIGDAALVNHVLHHHHVDTIVHFAAESHVDRSIQSPENFVDTNVKGTFTLLEAARHHWFDVEKCAPLHCRFHHISTDEVYGSLQLRDPAFTERSAYQPRSPYSATKASSDHLVQAYAHTYGLPITLSRCSNNYGPYQHDEKFIPTVIHHCLQHKPIPIYGNGKNIRDWLYVEDHCAAILTILKNGKVFEDYNIGGNNEWENLALAKYICAQMDKLKPWQQSYASLLSFIDDRPGHDFRYALDAGKIQRELGFKPQVNMENGMMKTIQFFIDKKNQIS